MIKIIWTLIGMNTIALLIFIVAYFIINQGKNASYEEKGWTIILAGIGLLVILLAAVPLRFSHSAFTFIFSGFFAALPLLITLGVLISKVIPSLKKKKTFAQTYYTDKAQRAIAASIEQNDTTVLRQLIKGQDLNTKGIRVWDETGLNYLQFAIRVRSNPIDFPFYEGANTAAIRILIAKGSPVTSALAEACRYLAVEEISLLLDAGANPNCPGFYNLNPLLFELIGNDKRQNDIAILLIQRGADVNAIKDKRWTPVMFAAERAGTSKEQNDTWRLVRYLMEKTNADLTYSDLEGKNFAGIIKNIRSEVGANNITMSPDFIAVVAGLKKHGIDTTPIVEKQLPPAVTQ